MLGLDPRCWPIDAPASMQLASIAITVMSRTILKI